MVPPGFSSTTLDSNSSGYQDAVLFDAAHHAHFDAGRNSTRQKEERREMLEHVTEYLQNRSIVPLVVRLSGEHVGKFGSVLANSEAVLWQHDDHNKRKTLFQLSNNFGSPFFS